LERYFEYNWVYSSSLKFAVKQNVVFNIQRTVHRDILL